MISYWLKGIQSGKVCKIWDKNLRIFQSLGKFLQISDKGPQGPPRIQGLQTEVLVLRDPWRPFLRSED
jgi:hypothetical protein